jgi:hypothetical protein
MKEESTPYAEEAPMKPVRLLVVVLAVVLVAGGTVLPTAEAQPPVRPSGGDHEGAYTTGAVISNIWYVPGRALVCGGTVLLSALILTITAGHSYDDAAVVARGGCGGPWLIRSADVGQALEPKSSDSPYWTEPRK